MCLFGPTSANLSVPAEALTNLHRYKSNAATVSEVLGVVREVQFTRHKEWYSASENSCVEYFLKSEKRTQMTSSSGDWVENETFFGALPILEA